MRILITLAAALLPALVHGQQQAPDFTGTWSGVMTTPSDDFWQVEDFVCFSGCPSDSYDYVTGLLDDPANAERPTREINAMAYQHMKKYLAERATAEGLKRQTAHTEENDPTVYCRPYGYARQVTNTLPMMIRHEGDNLVFQYEEWSLQRTIYMDGREHPPALEPALLGHSVGRYEGSTLVIDTVGVSEDIFYSYQSGGSHSDQLHGVERYTIQENPKRLVLELTLDDPVTLERPYVITKTWLHTPDIKLVQDSCEDIPGKP